MNGGQGESYYQTAIKHKEEAAMGGGVKKKKEKTYKAALSLDSMPNIVEALKLLPTQGILSTRAHPKKKSGES